jgi:SPP1 gp7 family putative phage head morphogenesis protein
MAEEKNASDKLADAFVTHTINLLRLSASEQKATLAALERLENELVRDIANAVGNTPAKMGQMRALLKQTRATIATTYGKISDARAKTLEGLAGVQERKVVNAINRVIQAPVATVGMSADQLKTIAGKTLVTGKYPSEWWSQQSQQLQDAFAVQMRLGMMRGESVEQLVSRVRGTRAAHYTDGIMLVRKHHAVALVRTSVLTVANEAKLETFRKNQALIKGVQWLATLDARTTPICRALDGKQWAFPELTPIGHDKVFPGAIAHWNCRSTQISVLRSWQELSGPKSKLKDKEGKPADIGDTIAEKLREKGMPEEQIQKVKVNTRASMDGQVSAGLDFEDWLQGKTPVFQDELLGPARAKIWRDGKATISQMTDQNNRPLSLAELRAMVDADEDVQRPPEPKPVRIPKPPKFKNIDQARDYMRDALQIGVIVTEPPPGTEETWGRAWKDKEAELAHVQIIAEAIQDMRERFPDMQSGTFGIMATQTDRARGTHDGPTPVFSLNQRPWTAAEREAAQRWAKENGRLYDTSDLTSDRAFMFSVVRHEIGHNLSVPEIEAMARAVVASRGAAWIAQNVSEYGGTNFMELIAETFAAFTAPGYVRGTYPPDIEAFLRKMVGET